MQSPVHKSALDVEDFKMANAILSSFNNIIHLIPFPWLNARIISISGNRISLF